MLNHTCAWQEGRVSTWQVRVHDVGSQSLLPLTQPLYQIILHTPISLSIEKWCESVQLQGELARPPKHLSKSGLSGYAANSTFKLQPSAPCRRYISLMQVHHLCLISGM